MTKRKYQRIIVRSELIRDAQKIQKLCGLANWGAAINLVFAMYREQVLEQLKTNPNKAVSTIAATKKSTGRANSKQSSSEVLPSPPIVPEPSGGGLRDFLRAKVREGI